MEESDRTIPSTTDVTYGGAVIAKLVAGQTATLRCARQRMKSNITVTAGSGVGGKTISANAFATTLVTAKINLDMTVSAKASVVNVISTNINLKRPNITTNIIVEVTE